MNEHKVQTWADAYDDRLTATSHEGLDTFYIDASAEVELSREQARELRDMLSQHLLDTDPHPFGPSPEDLDAAGVPDSIALEAHHAVYGDRQADYGHPREDFTRTAIIWTGLLQHKLAEGAYIEAEDVPRCMIGVKLARDVHSPKRDNRVDIAGYAITLDRLETGK